MNMQYPHGRVLIFARWPRPGHSKTRLIPALGREGAARLHAGLLRATTERVLTSGLAPAQLWVDSAQDTACTAIYRELFDGELYVQCRGDLGARMAHALDQALRQAAFAVLIGSDCPAMDNGYLQRACELLATGHEAVLGPAEDGGYVLIGLRRSDLRLFDGIAWGTSAVAAQTRERFAALGRTLSELPSLWDVDRPEDLPRLYALDESWRDMALCDNE
jgi:rSAM/selenodomain-associated transferase 1